MTVDLIKSGASAIETKDFVVAKLLVRGFSDAGKDGRDAIRNEETVFYFRGPDEIEVVIQVGLVNEVAIRINQNRETFTAEASRIFEDVAAALEARWPGAVVREPAPTR